MRARIKPKVCGTSRVSRSQEGEREGQGWNVMVRADAD